MTQQDAKRLVGQRGVELVESVMTIGLDAGICGNHDPANREGVFPSLRSSISR